MFEAKTKESPTFECPTCKKTFTTAQFLKKHVKLHTGEWLANDVSIDC